MTCKAVNTNNTEEYALFLFNALHAKECVVCKDCQWYLWTNEAKLVRTELPDYETTWTIDPDDRANGPDLNNNFGTIYQVGFSNNRLYLWVEG